MPRIIVLWVFIVGISIGCTGVRWHWSRHLGRGEYISIEQVLFGFDA